MTLSLIGVKSRETALAASEGAGGSEPFLLTKGPIFPYFRGNNVQLFGLETTALSLAR